MNAKQRLNIINKIAQNKAFFANGDEYWLIGMLSDTALSGDKLKEEIESLKRDFPEYHVFLRFLICETSKNE